MKRVRTEQIQYTVAQYLKRRQYVDTDGSLKGAKLFQSAEEMAASLTGEPRAQVKVTWPWEGGGTILCFLKFTPHTHLNVTATHTTYN